MPAPPDDYPRIIDAATQTEAELDELLARLQEAESTNIGFPAATDFDFGHLAPFLRYMLNNLGDPTIDGSYPHHTKAMEREAVNVLADLLRAPRDDRWGYVTSGASEGSEYALHLARTMHPKGIVYHSHSAHHCIANAVDRLAMDSIGVRADERGEIDYRDLAVQVNRNRDRPVIVVACIGTPMTEAVDDVRRITEILDSLSVRRRWIHADAALSGIPLALLDAADRPGFDFADGASSIIVSGHKFLGSPIPYGVVLVRDSLRPYGARAATYTGSPDATLSNSRCGLAALTLWYTLRSHGLPGLRARAKRSREFAAYTHARLLEIGWDAHRNPHAFTVHFATPPDSVASKWVLSSQHGRSHIICVPGVTLAQIDAFIADLRAVIPQTRTTPASNGKSGSHTVRVRHPTAPYRR